MEARKRLQQRREPFVHGAEAPLGPHARARLLAHNQKASPQLERPLSRGSCLAGKQAPGHEPHCRTFVDWHFPVLQARGSIMRLVSSGKALSAPFACTWQQRGCFLNACDVKEKKSRAPGSSGCLGLLAPCEATARTGAAQCPRVLGIAWSLNGWFLLSSFFFLVGSLCVSHDRDGLHLALVSAGPYVAARGFACFLPVFFFLLLSLLQPGSLPLCRMPASRAEKLHRSLEP